MKPTQFYGCYDLMFLGFGNSEACFLLDFIVVTDKAVDQQQLIHPKI
jgi:hypothetical protein